MSVQDIFRELLNTQIAVAVGGKVSNNRDILAARREGGYSSVPYFQERQLLIGEETG